MTSDFGAMLQRHREQLGWTQEKLAELAGLSAEAVSSIERGARRYPQRETVRRLVDALALKDRDREVFLAAVPHAVRHRSGLTASSESSRASPVVPRQLPAAAANFTGRVEPLRQLTTLLAQPSNSPGPVVAVLTGMGGIGKTALATQVGHAVVDHYPDGQLYIDLRGFGPDDPMTAIDALGYLLRALGTPAEEIPLEVQEASARFRTALAIRRVLLIVDNARDVAHVRPLLPGTAGSALIMTSRRSLAAVAGALHLRLDAMPAVESLQMLRSLTGDRRFDDDRAAASEVVSLCGSLPLAIRMAGARLAARPQWPLSHLAQRLKDERIRLDELERDDTGVRASFAVSVDQLIESTDPQDRRAAEAFVLLGVPDGPDISLLVGSRLIDRTVRETERTLERLVDLHLLEAPAPGRYRLHDLLRVYARERAVESLTESERAAALTRVLQLYVGAAWLTLSLVQPQSRARLPWGDDWTDGSPDLTEAGQAVAWLEDHRPHLVSAVRQSVSTDGVSSELGIRLAAGLFGYYATRRHWLDWTQATGAALAAAERAHDRTAEGMLRNDLGLALARLAEGGSGSYDDAVSQLHLSLGNFRSIGDRQREAMCLVNLTLVLRLASRFDEAIACGERGLALARELDDVNGEVAACANLGPAYGGVGDHDRQLARLLHCRSLAARIDSDHIVAEVHQLLANAYESTGEHTLAQAELRASSRVFLRSGDPLGAASALDELGAIQLGIGDNARAVRDLTEALAVADQYDDDGRCTASIRHHLGLALREFGRLDDAALHLEAALATYERKNMAAADEVRAIVTSLN